MTDSREAALWHRGLRGDAEAFGALFDLHRDRVFRHAFRILQNHADAEDATAVSFLELWRRHTHVRVVNGSVLPWLLVTVTNASRNLRRSRARYWRLLEALPREDSVPSAEEIAFVRAELSPELGAALKTLGSRDAQLLSLVALEGYQIADAAAALGLTPGAARTRLHRVRTRLQHSLGHDTLASYLTQEAIT